MADIFGFEKIEHAQAVDRVFAGGALVDIRSQRNFRGIEPPRHEALVAHTAVPRLVIGPARGIVDPLPGQEVGESAQHHAAIFDGPDFVDVTDGRAQLQLHSFAVGISGIDHVRPVEAAGPEARVARGPVGDGIGSGAGTGPEQPQMKKAHAYSPDVRKAFAIACVQASAPSRNSGSPASADSPPLLEGPDLFCLFGQRERQKAVRGPVGDGIGGLQIRLKGIAQRGQKNFTDAQQERRNRGRILDRAEKLDQARGRPLALPAGGWGSAARRRDFAERRQFPHFAR